MFDLARKVGARGLLAASIAAGAALIAFPAAAQYHGGYHGGGGWHGGGWHRSGWHGGWSVGIGVYDPWWPGYYPGYWDPAYPYYGQAPVTVIQPAPQVQMQMQAPAGPPTYYYCDNPAGYYPYVQQCTQPWRPVAAQPQAAPAAPPNQ